MDNVYVARQPIFDRRMRVVGYELLFRDSTANRANVQDQEVATASVVLNSLTEIGLKRIVGARGAWVKVPRELVRRGLVALLPRRAVVEIMKGQIGDDETAATVAELKRDGRRVALDHFRFTPEAEPLLRLVDVAKLDLIDLGREDFTDELARLKRYGVTVLAERVESQRDHAFCRQAGCDLFQGYFFCRPEVMQGRRIDASRLAVLDLLTVLEDPRVELSDLQSRIALDVRLSVRLLRFINSAFFGLGQPIRSIAQAIALLGVENLRRWAALTLFAGVEGKPTELTVTALARARFCQLAGEHLGVERLGGANGNELFTVGLFSVLDALMDLPIEYALAGIPLAQDIREALIYHRGPTGQLLDCLIALQEADFDRAETLFAAAGPIYMSALAWADETAAPLFAE
jgi:EAL and modified HD-GYP domain-containing signal transduction protein